MASKLREQSDTIRLLQADKKSLSEEIQTSTNRIRSIEASNAEFKTEQLKLKVRLETTNIPEFWCPYIGHKTIRLLTLYTYYYNSLAVSATLADFLQSLQEHSSRQQTLLRQLQNKLEEYE